MRSNRSARAAIARPEVESSQIPAAADSPPLDAAEVFIPESWKGLRWLRKREMMPHLPIKEETVRLWERDGRFPKRQHLSKTCCVWPAAAVIAWLADPFDWHAQA